MVFKLPSSDQALEQCRDLTLDPILQSLPPFPPSFPVRFEHLKVNRPQRLKCVSRRLQCMLDHSQENQVVFRFISQRIEYSMPSWT